MTNEVLNLINAAVIFLAAVLTLRAASVEIRNNIDKFIDDLNRQARWARRGALAAALAALLTFGVAIYGYM